MLLLSKRSYLEAVSSSMFQIRHQSWITVRFRLLRSCFGAVSSSMFQIRHQSWITFRFPLLRSSISCTTVGSWNPFQIIIEPFVWCLWQALSLLHAEYLLGASGTDVNDCLFAVIFFLEKTSLPDLVFVVVLPKFLWLKHRVLKYTRTLYSLIGVHNTFSVCCEL